MRWLCTELRRTPPSRKKYPVCHSVKLHEPAPINEVPNSMQPPTKNHLFSVLAPRSPAGTITPNQNEVSKRENTALEVRPIGLPTTIWQRPVNNHLAAEAVNQLAATIFDRNHINTEATSDRLQSKQLKPPHRHAVWTAPVPPHANYKPSTP